MDKLPNQEQLKAIQHQGGVLLKAGAGSGKTFVLVEHIVHLTASWMREFDSLVESDFELFIRNKFSTVVMMTFTKKAAGEMSTRLNTRFENLSLKASPQQKYWEQALSALPLLTVTTIDGFCRRLITSGIVPGLSSQAKVIFKSERTDQIRIIFEDWFEREATQLNQLQLEILLREKDSILKAFTEIFLNPGLRLMWKDFDPERTAPNYVDEVIQASIELNGLHEQLKRIQCLNVPHPDEQSAFERGIIEFNQIIKELPGNPLELARMNHYLQSKRFMGERTQSKKCQDYDDAHESRKILKEWAKDWAPIVEVYVQNYEFKVLPWVEFCKKLYLSIDSKLDPNSGLTFGDIEYYVALALRNPDVKASVKKQFDYFIVDEFQDTSYLQFEIVKLLIDHDFNKLFCVGDAKQAIYGFRGGELMVFNECAKLVPLNFTLANNYRSLPNIINFNNSLFRTVLPLGQGFQGHDPFSVKPEDQAVPEELSFANNGKISVIRASLVRDTKLEGKLTSKDLDLIESQLIADSIQTKRQTAPLEIITVLYSNLAPSLSLIRFLMDKNIGFSAQFKINLLDEPMMGIFMLLIKRRFIPTALDGERFSSLLVGQYLDVLNLKIEFSPHWLAEFDLDVAYWGFIPAFQKFIRKLGITNENADLNLVNIETLARLCNQNPEQLMLQLQKNNGEKVSLELRSGMDTSRVQIMTAHASKGLEFDTVFLGGIYSNGRDNNRYGLLGKMPGSLKWYDDLSKRVHYDSPFFLFEQELDSYKKFSESKRLFYVACTRAKQQLSWVKLDFETGTAIIPKDSWIDGLDKWLEINGEQARNKLEYIDRSDFNYRDLLGEKTPPSLPLFFYDPSGIISIGLSNGKLGLGGELSVTRLNSLLDCPRKFYLQNTLKLKDEKSLFDSPEEPEELGEAIKSSSRRGTDIHSYISQGILHNLVVPLEIFNTPERRPVEWALDELRKIADDFELVTEKQLKFKFFNFMINGIPDLLLLPKKNQTAQIWDFKTGKITENGLAKYWFQLKTYGYALYQLGRVSSSSEIELKLVFVDQQKVLTEHINWQKAQNDLYQIWQQQNEPWRINSDHCSQCVYGDICPR